MRTMKSDDLGKMLKRDWSQAVVLFAGEWCSDCREFRPTWDRWVASRSVRAFVTKVPLGGAEWGEWHLDEVPTVCVFSRGKEVGRVHGAITLEDLDNLVRQAAAT